MDKVYLQSASFDFPTDTVFCDGLPSIGIRRPYGRLDLSFQGDEQLLYSLYQDFCKKDYIDAEGLEDFALPKRPMVPENCCSYCGKKYDSNETSCHACGGPRSAT